VKVDAASTEASSGADRLAVEHLSVRAGARLVLDRVSFTAQSGEITAVIGPNGAGKTSLLETIVGLRSPESGSVRVTGKALPSFGARARTFAYLPDQSELAAEARVGTLIDHALGCATSAVSVAELRSLLAIDRLLDLGAGVLSRGERQRVLLFCTLVLGRPIVVLDEPFSAFDPLQLRDVVLAIRSIAQGGTAVLASIHQLADAEKIADRILLLAEGRAVAFGTASELKVEAGSVAMPLEEVFIAFLARRSRAT
jgi:ABC-2 type transport system ATP-binding protein